MSGKAPRSPALGTRELLGGPAQPVEDAEAPGGPAQPGESRSRWPHQGSRALQALASLGVLRRRGQDRHAVCVLRVRARPRGLGRPATFHTQRLEHMLESTGSGLTLPCPAGPEAD